jgi:hypothetical protein
VQNRNWRKDFVASKYIFAQTLTSIVEFAIVTALMTAILFLFIIVASATTLDPATEFLHQGHRSPIRSERRAPGSSAKESFIRHSTVEYLGPY